MIHCSELRLARATLTEFLPRRMERKDALDGRTIEAHERVPLLLVADGRALPGAHPVPNELLEAGEGGAVLVWEPSPEGAEDTSAKGGVLKEVAVKNGDFLAFRAGVERAHTLRAGSTEMVYLVGGSRWERDVCRYPLEGKKLLIECPPGGSRKETLEDEEIGTPLH